EYNIQADVYDPWVDVAEAQHEYGLTPIDAPRQGAYDAIIVGVAHEQFKAMGPAAIRALGKKDHVVYDLKYVLPRDAADLRL
ncbi:TPA: Vi polysaccharide biosynthesis protein VipA/TviB, partial [Candidatus Saccharibacteria bacterium]|nr:Vi polysaccharide biosynthesis protein VipA/TviB [Candidatus Saccharibacteria bacterium]